MSFLLDTDICSAQLKSGVLTHRLVQYAGRLHISTITLAELYTWTHRAKAPQRRAQGIADLLSDLVVLDLTRDVAQRFGEIQAALLDRGQRVPSLDLLIGATALVHGLTMVTHNHQHFSKIPNLQLDDWLVP